MSTSKFASYQGTEEQMLSALGLDAGGIIHAPKKTTKISCSDNNDVVVGIRPGLKGGFDGDGGRGRAVQQTTKGKNNLKNENWADDDLWYDFDPPVPNHVSIRKKVNHLPPPPPKPMIETTISSTTMGAQSTDKEQHIDDPKGNQVEMRRLRALQDTINHSRMERRRRGELPSISQTIKGENTEIEKLRAEIWQDSPSSHALHQEEKKEMEPGAINTKAHRRGDKKEMEPGVINTKANVIGKDKQWNHAAEYETLKAAWLRQEGDRRAELKKAMMMQETKTAHEDDVNAINRSDADEEPSPKQQPQRGGSKAAGLSFRNSSTAMGSTADSKNQLPTLDWGSMFNTPRASSWFKAVCTSEGFASILSCHPSTRSGNCGGPPASSTSAYPNSCNKQTNEKLVDCFSFALSQDQQGGGLPSPTSATENDPNTSSQSLVSSPPLLMAQPALARRSMCFERNGKTKRSLTFVVDANDDTLVGDKLRDWILQDEKMQTDVWFVGSKRSKWLQESKLLRRYDNPHTGNFISPMFEKLRISDICALDPSQPIKFSIEYQRRRVPTEEEYSDEEDEEAEKVEVEEK